MKAIPINDKEVEEVKKALMELKKGIVNLGLEGPFGKFLEATVEEGAFPKDLFDDEIKKKMDEYNLWESFRVHLGH